eukprot:CAMPEP_0184318760 /NCGR_PEP_ID=MMETSP1049-20130417/104644_1 /TAXON_ID=77928 /ORGANISM="Proteomonas sulcata, Strain CCMP704" /LENGTH=145 /DNA_ID=CAMNT_0026638643 /DNA_START=86 /DNA_END=521 /DNA_ORIENTATION=-
MTPRRSLSADKKGYAHDMRKLDLPEDRAWRRQSISPSTSSAAHRGRSRTPALPVETRGPFTAAQEVDLATPSPESSPALEEHRTVSPGRVCVPETRRRLLRVGQHLESSREQRQFDPIDPELLREGLFCESWVALNPHAADNGLF